jgi:hypothetical protein
MQAAVLRARQTPVRAADQMLVAEPQRVHLAEDRNWVLQEEDRNWARQEEDQSLAVKPAAHRAADQNQPGGQAARAHQRTAGQLRASSLSVEDVEQRQVPEQLRESHQEEEQRQELARRPASVPPAG